MSSPNEISAMQKIMVKPIAWRINQSPDKSYQLEFTYLNDQREFAQVQTRGREIKIYKKIAAVFADIDRVQIQALIHYQGAGQ